MSKGRLAQFEQRIAHLVEGSFARLLAGRLHPQELAVRLTRAMDDNVRTGVEGKLTAPNVYSINLNADDHAVLLKAHPDLAMHLAEKIIEIAATADLRLLETPVVDLYANAGLPPFSIIVEARHVYGSNPSTESMQPVPAPPEIEMPKPNNPQLMIHGNRYIPLTRPVINIGRRRDNHVVIDDPRISRTHAQLRLRFGRYVLYDLGSKAGTFVNEHRITECILRPGDVISLAGLMVVYIEDEVGSKSSSIHDTQMRPPASVADNDPTL